MRNSEFDPRYLLLLEAGKQQVVSEGLLPAWDRYDTKIFRDLRVWRNAGRVLPTILILSPLHDLIEPTFPIANYDPDETKLEADVADMIASDPDNIALFRHHFEHAQRTLCVTEKRAAKIFQRWLRDDEKHKYDGTFQYEGRGLSHKRETMRQFMELVPQNGYSHAA